MAEILLFHHAQGLTPGVSRSPTSSAPPATPFTPRISTRERRCRARRRHGLPGAGRLRDDHGPRPGRRGRLAEQARLRRLLARRDAGADACTDPARSSGSAPVPCLCPDVGVRRPLAGGRPAPDPHEGGRRVGGTPTSPARSRRRPRAPSCSCTRAIGTSSPTAASPTTTRTLRRSSRSAYPDSSTSSRSDRGERASALPI